MPDLWQTTAGGVSPPAFIGTPTTTRQYNRQQSMAEIARLGRAGYMEARPEVYTPGPYNPYATDIYTEAARFENQISDLRYILGQFSGTEGTFARYLIRKRMDELWGERERIFGRTPKETTTEPPIPDWLKDYIETTQAVPAQPIAGKRRARPQSTTTQTLRPIGAQAELDPEQLGLMAGYLGWTQAGAPTGYSEGALKTMSDIGRWWSPHTALSASLFPKQTKLGKGWMPAKQR